MKHEVTEVTEPVSLMAKHFSSSEPPASPSHRLQHESTATTARLGDLWRWPHSSGGQAAPRSSPGKATPPLSHPPLKKKPKYTALEAPFPCVYLSCQFGSFSQSPGDPYGMGPASEWDWCHLLSPLFLLPET